MIKNKPFLLLLIFFVCLIELNAQERTFLVPGIKFSKVLWEKGETVFGIDLSVIFMQGNKKGNLGINTTYDFLAKNPKLTFGFEYIIPEFPTFGISVGPALNLNDNSFGIYSALFFVTPIIPVFQYTYYIGDVKSITEFGIFGKLPLKIGGTKEGYFDMNINLNLSGM